MLEKFEDFIKHSKRDEDITDLEISKHDDDYKLTYFTTAEGTAQTIEERYSYIKENDTFQLFYKKDIPYALVTLWVFLGILIKHVTVFGGEYKGIIIMTACLMAYLFSSYISKKIIEIHI